MLEREVLKDVPNKPGVYIYKNKKEKIIYVGKAKNLKKRVSSYFNKSNQLKSEKVFNIMKYAETIDYIVTTSEEEALILEGNLIFEYKPKYNVLLKDTKVYPYILVTNEKYPTLKYVRNKSERGKYFGPYSNVYFVKSVIEVLQRVYGIRNCERNVEKKSKPCFLYHLGMCYGPCYKEVDFQEYQKSVGKVIKFLNGDVESVKKYLEEAMKKYAKVLNFERAAQMRDTLFKLDKLFIPLGVEFKTSKNVDIIMYEDPIYVLLRVRRGYLISKLTFTLSDEINEFLKQFYIVRKNQLPIEIMTMYDESINESVLDLLKKHGLKRITTINKNNNIFKIAFKNLEEEIKRYTNLGNILKQAKEILSLKKIPQKIEGIDISHLQGMYTVASLISFEDGKPNKNNYRRYRLDEFKEPNDFESIRTVIKRRYSKHELPDLLFIDGGKGQVNSAVEALNEIGFTLNDVDVVGIAKEDERIVFPGDFNDLHLPLDHPVLRLLIYMRDETHRFAIGFNRKLRSKRFEKTKLDEIEGIGPKRKKLLIQEFGGLTGIKNATVEEIDKIIKNKKLSMRIKESFGGK
ncbi:UvrABC system protein C [Tepiditoga spiralis]|uniref:UvrABC system protein C n=1 Tax=Tepiditoga spiralis TaxID=2108365 RepID=A0A7G1G6P5_9BACT|nr:excinuclease ABC subunit UvrC [Tepiditoga spiralis]BBE30567.1 UvrABC system protein C [Tepiditoga spiralis]